jgi:membrane protease YdiL (CAAX protease family)
MLRETGSYLSWVIEPGFWNVVTSYSGLNAVAAWEELFFITVVLTILRRHIPFWQANAVQAIMFASFLFSVGWIGWSFFSIVGFALTQGYIYKRTGSLAYVLAIHLSLDIFVHLSILELNHPGWVPIFIT